MAFLTGWLAGPRRIPLEPGLGINRRFGQSVMALLYHEVALLFNFGVLLALPLSALLLVALRRLVTRLKVHHVDGADTP